MSAICLFSFALIVAPACGHGGLPGVKTGLFGELMSHADFQVNLHPPGESSQDAANALDALSKEEDTKQRHAGEAFAAAKQRMLNVEKGRVRDMVRGAFEPLLAKPPMH